uniref:NADH dehydrogenase subunit 6 n=1 Tax=Lepidoglyphus destructor TaxID=36936 RepID=UPI001FF4C1F4|nr:NADH dehydrogenase subunit 6 [Lepidoglyphus destructor]UOG85323.1 NADH dehydrogenase subunit 6 [Lepidoglyphus destructor]
MFLTLLCVVALMMTASSPMKLAFTLTVSSLGVSTLVYMSTASVFPPSALVISFSSGMMILFCYSSTMTSYESKTTPNILSSTLCLLACPALLVSSNSMLSSPMKKCVMELNTPLLLGMMGLILCCMVAINMSVMDPTKQLMNSY